MSDGGELDLETGFPYETVRALMRKGHSVRFADGPYGGYQAIMRDPQRRLRRRQRVAQGRTGGGLLMRLTGVRVADGSR